MRGPWGRKDRVPESVVWQITNFEVDLAPRLGPGADMAGGAATGECLCDPLVVPRLKMGCCTGIGGSGGTGGLAEALFRSPVARRGVCDSLGFDAKGLDTLNGDGGTALAPDEEPIWERRLIRDPGAGDPSSLAPEPRTDAFITLELGPLPSAPGEATKAPVLVDALAAFANAKARRTATFGFAALRKAAEADRGVRGGAPSGVDETDELNAPGAGRRGVTGTVAGPSSSHDIVISASFEGLL